MPLRSERRYISLDSIKSGMMVQFSYTKKSGDTDQYVVLVVDPDRQNSHASEPQLHGFVVDNMSDEDIIKLLSTISKNINIDSENRRASLAEELNTDEAYQMFKSSAYVKDRSYRTFNLSSISSVRQVLIGQVK